MTARRPLVLRRTLRQDISRGELSLGLTAKQTVVDLRHGVLSWSRPSEVVVSGPEKTTRLPIADVTRRIQAALLLLVLLFAFGALIYEHKKKDG